MLWNTLIWLWNGANLSIYKHVTHFVPNIRHKAYSELTKLEANMNNSRTLLTAMNQSVCTKEI